jgi:hypothetical protein
MRIPSSLLRDRVTVERYTGSGAYGPSFGEPLEDVPMRIEGVRRAVRTAAGVDVIGSATGWARPDLDITPESKLTTASGRVYTVLDVLPGEGLSRTAYQQLILQ